MRNVWLVGRREYLERARTKSFILSTLLFPALIVALLVLPTKLTLLKTTRPRQIAVVCANPDFARGIKAELESGPAQAGKLQASPKYQVELVTTPDESTRRLLKDRVSGGQLDGYVWLDEAALASRKITYLARDTNDFIAVQSLQGALRTALLRQQLVGRGVPAEDLDKLMQDVDLDTVAIKGGKETRTSSGARLVSVLVLTMMLYTTLILYGVTVMRSVLEEKTSRIVEVVLSSANAWELMAGKILGVGAVAMTQILVWTILGLTFTAPGFLAMSGGAAPLHMPALALPAFALFFVLGYLLYSTMYAALGAMVNSEQDAQQWGFFIVTPMIIPVMMLSFVIRQPDAALSIWMSLIPFFAPILMYMRIVVQTPPAWQIALCVALQLLTLWAMVTLCSRIYRVGILMYGKKPNLPEIIRWVKYA